jgi:hypothetical protein
MDAATKKTVANALLEAANEIEGAFDGKPSEQPRLKKYGEAHRKAAGKKATVVVRGVRQQNKGDSFHVRVLKGDGKDEKRGSVLFRADVYIKDHDYKEAKALKEAKKLAADWMKSPKGKKKLESLSASVVSAEDGDLVFHAATRGGKWQLKVFSKGNYFSYEETKGGRGSAGGSQNTEAEMQKRLAQLLYSSSKDGINYKIVDGADFLGQKWLRELKKAGVSASVVSAAAMGDSEFWKIVDKLGWGTKTTDSDKLKKILLNSLAPEEAEGLQDAFSKAQGTIGQAIDKHRKANDIDMYMGGDGFSDLTAHIVGLGKREFDKHVKNPQLAIDRFNKGDFTESFAYVIPYKDDYKSLKPDKYIEWAQGMIDQKYLEEPLAEIRDTIEKAEEIEADADLVQKALEAIAKGDIKGGRKVEREVREAIKRLSKSLGVNEWAVLNLYSDMKRYLD